MAPILRVKARWGGFAGAPGYTVLHFRDFGTEGAGGSDPDAAQAQAAAARVRTFFDAVKGFLPIVVTVQVEGDVDVIESTTGELVNSLSITAPAVVTGTGTGNYSPSSGVVLNWKTGGIRKGRRIRGRSFIVPLVASVYSTTGTLNGPVRSTIATAAAALADSTSTPDLGVYARPSGPGATDGQWSVVTASSVPDLIAVLRSRRD